MPSLRHPVRGLLALCALAFIATSVRAADPGLVFPPTSEISDQKKGSVLIYNIYTSGATGGNAQNTAITITNTSSTSASFVHLFFVDQSCSVADAWLCLTANQTRTFYAFDMDPGITGYMVAVASDGVLGCPTSFNHLIGSLSVKFATGHQASLGAEAVSALYNGSLPGCDGTSVTATLNFNGVVGGGYGLLPAVLAGEVRSRVDGNDTLLILNRLGGNLAIGSATLGSLFGQFFDDQENVLSFSFTGSCQFRSSLSNTFPRLTPRFETFVPQGHTGWFKIFNQTGAIAISGAVINYNPNAGTSARALNGGVNLHKLTLTTSSYTIPIFPPSC
jgi:hypothetical protein